MTKDLDFNYNNKFICGLFQRELRSELVHNYDILSSYFLRSVKDSSTSLVIQLMNYLNTTPYKKIDADGLYSYLMSDVGLIKEEALPLVELAMKSYQDEDKSNYTEIMNKLRTIGNIEITERANKMSKGDPLLYVKYIKEMEYQKVFSDKIKIHYLDDYDPVELMDEYLSADKVIPSSFKFINDASHMGGYLPGQIIMVTSPPGGGKTLFMMREAMHMIENGHKVLYVALADMNIADFYIRLYAMSKNVPFRDATINFEDAYAAIHKLGKNFPIIIEPAGKISMEEIVELVHTRFPDVTAVFADYDSQFLIERSYGSMYEDAVQPYTDASVLKDEGKLVFIGSQPRTSYYACEYLDLNSAGESSRKQQQVDFIMSIGTNEENSIPCGYIANPKARRGFSKFKIPYVRTIDGNMHKVPFGVYQQMRTRIDDPDLTSEKLERIIRDNGTLVDNPDSATRINGAAVPSMEDISAQTNPLIQAININR